MADRNGEVLIAGSCRTAIGKFLGALATIPATRLGAHVIRESLARAGVAADQVDEVIMGQVVQAGAGQAPARQAAIHAGIPASVGAMTINKVCGSGLKAIMLAAQAIRAGDADVIVAGGMESMSQAPYLLRKARTGMRLGHGTVDDAVVLDGLWDSFNDYHMGSAAEHIARQYDVSRDDQDAYALGSQQKAVAAIQGGKFESEIVSLDVPQRRGDPVRFAVDESPRADSSLEALARLRPAFEKGGTVTAGNAPGLNDGASAVVVLSERKAAELGVQAEARITGYATGGAAPEMVFWAPVDAVRKLMRRMNVTIDHWERIEANEAFAVQCLVDGRELEWDWDRVNVHGGAIALGHPIGASGARVLTTLLGTLRDAGMRRGMATLCLGGGNAVAMGIERV
ncbi:MAG: acetyl-CoA C-acetyltransferase [Candidatus Eiseniibacteriota bacterium]|jgi:acetyl-CoA C-acetyltransferase